MNNEIDKEIIKAVVKCKSTDMVKSEDNEELTEDSFEIISCDIEIESADFMSDTIKELYKAWDEYNERHNNK